MKGRKTTLILHLILIVCLLAPHSVSAQTEFEFEEKVNSVSDYVESAILELDIPGAGLGIVYDGHIVHTQGWGVTGGEENPVTINTPFLVGSNSKALTAYGVLKLAQDGNIELDDRVQEYLPWFTLANEYSASTITIKQLISHTSGLSSISGYNISDLGAQNQEAIQKIVRDLKDEEVSFEPGDSYEYSAANYAVLGALIESVTGLTFAEYMRQDIFLPMGMRHTAAEFQLAKEFGWEPGYRTFVGMNVPSTIPYDDGGATYGYISSSVEDMARWLTHLQGSTGVLDETYTEQSLQPIVDTGLSTSYGFGWRITKLEDDLTRIWHSGSTADFRSEVFMLPEMGWGIVILTNQAHALDASTLSEVTTGVTSILTGNNPDSIDQTIAMEFLFLGCIISLVLLLLIFAIKANRKQKATTSKQRWIMKVSGLGLIVASITVIPLLLSVLKLNWRIFMLYAPDFAWLTLLMVFLLLVTGLLFLKGSHKRVK